MNESLDLERLAVELEKAGSPWEMDKKTDMALMTEPERLIRLGFTPPPGELQFAEAAAMAAAQPILTSAEIAAEIAAAPPKFDLSDVEGKDYTTPVKNQGGCGSCVAFGTVAVLETTYKFTRRNPNLTPDFSEAHLFYCHGAAEGRNCSNGWWPENALKAAKSKGVAFDAFYPYTAGDQACQVQSGWTNNWAKPTGQTKLNSRAEMKEWISSKGSITGCFVVFQDFFSYRSGVYRHVSGEAAGGHCVEIIGYDDNQGCWICKNSWGTNWGEGGYFRIAYGQCNIETWAGPFGANGVSLRTWSRNTRVNGLWTNQSARNAYVHLANVGWRRVAHNSAANQHAMLSELIAAKSAGRIVHALEENNRIRQIYVI